MSDVRESKTRTESREERNARRLGRWEKATQPAIVVAAILPIVVSLTERGDSSLAVWLDLASWAVFIADLVVHVRLKPGYLKSRLGIFDLVIVLLTAPWYLVPGLDDTRVLQLARLGRLGRVFIASRQGSGLRDLGRRLGQAALYSLVLILCCGLIVRSVEPEGTGIETFGDAMWWSLVTFTTVGYGDIVPVTTAGRVSAVFLMLGGIALIGALAGSLSSFFGSDGDKPDDVLDDPRPDPAAPHRAADPASELDLADEVRRLRREIAELRDDIAAPLADRGR